MMSRRPYRLGWFLWVAGGLAGCQGPSPDSDAGFDFVVDNPQADAYGPSADDGGGTGAAGDGDGDGDDAPEEDGGRDIAEADIIALDGDRLYALSESGGLSVIDVSRPDALPILGRYRARARPFEMYVQDGQVFLMLSDWGRYAYSDDEDAYTWASTSTLVALDATDPADIEVRGEFDIVGSMQDSRRVGDVLYLVTRENGWCWGCAETANTTITSLDVSDPRNVVAIDSLVLDDDPSSWGNRSVSSTSERMYVSSAGWSEEDDESWSEIDVIDISDPAGTLRPGSSIRIAGEIRSRWQMDEYGGVLRVVSQPWTDEPPSVETFTVRSAQDVTPLGQLTMRLPRPESLQSVRFDGDRGYAITFERTDPLFTLDLSDPAAPRQVGELEIPGWVYHMEPRGDRVLGLGFDREHPDGALNVSLFDVSDFENPSLMSRVHFGGDWASFNEDQNRVHKALSVLDDLGLLLVPFSGWDRSVDPESNFEECDGGRYLSGIQLVDWVDDALSLRGVAEADSTARRALIHDDRLLTVSERNVESFSIDDRDAPQRTAAAGLAMTTQDLAVDGDTTVRLSRNWLTGHIGLEVVPTAEADVPTMLGHLDLTEIFETNAADECWYYDVGELELEVRDGYAYLLRSGGGGPVDGDWDDKQQATLDVFDLSDPSEPAHVDTVGFPFTHRYRSHWEGGIGIEDSRTVWNEDTLVVSAIERRWDDDRESSTATIEAIDLSDPGRPGHAGTLERPDAIAHGDLMQFGDAIVSWHMTAANADRTKVRFHLDRFSMSADGSPVARPSVNVPGVVVAYDSRSQSAITVGLELGSEPRDGTCWSHPRAVATANGCTLAWRDIFRVWLEGDAVQRVERVRLEDEDTRIHQVVASESRLFVTLQHGVWSWDEDTGSETPPSFEVSIVDLEDLDDLSEAARVDVGHNAYWRSTMVASGDHLLFNDERGMVSIDSTDVDEPELQIEELYGYGCWAMTIDEDVAYCAMGDYGVQRLPLR